MKKLILILIFSKKCSKIKTGASSVSRLSIVVLVEVVSLKTVSVIFG